jgi:hypothetical protein
MIAAGAIFIAVGVAAAVYSGLAVAVPLDYTLTPGLTDEITPDMDEGNQLSIQAAGSIFDFSVHDPDRNALVTVANQTNFSYDLTADKSGVYRVTIKNTGNSDVVITGTAQTKAGPLGFTGPMMLIITGVIVAGISLRFRRR